MSLKPRVQLCIVVGVTLLVLSPPAWLGAATDESFDHLSTGFPLTGAHERVRCESCHFRGIFEGTSRSCVSCHGGVVSQEATKKSPNHIPSSDACADCHVTVAWSVVRFEHTGITDQCVTCHNGATATGKSSRHVPSSNDCEVCHSTFAWSPATFDHASVTGNCVSCHNGATATGKARDHIPSDNSCESCHNTSSWAIAGGFDHSTVTGACSSCHNGTFARGKEQGHIPSDNTCENCHDTSTWTIAGGFDHSNVTGACSSCHNGTFARGKELDHIPSDNTCESCHNTSSWTIAGGFDHSGVTGSCSSCHNGTFATGMGQGHFVTSVDCVECHNTSSWDFVRFTHSSPNYPGDHAGNLSCQKCHLSNSQAVAWPFGSYQPDCAGCHANDYKQGPHKKYENPDTFYSVSDLRDCAGSCHLYTDSSMTQIKKSRSGEHRVNRGSFD